ncbi:MAG: endonuclease III [Thermoleophilia bacterium]|nr:endonuclease III [Thermoleophilia bacterium]
MPEPQPDAIAAALTARYGKPAPPSAGLESFEALVVTILDRALDPPKRDAAVAALRDAGLLDPQALAESDPAEAVEALRSAGVKIPDRGLAPLNRVARWLVDRHRGDADALAGPDGRPSTEQLRDELTAINGVGPATADALLLFALRRPVYPLDRPTYRILVRHGWADESTGYDEAREVVERLAPDDPVLLARLSAWFQRVGRDACTASVAKCDRCPLRPFLPEGGPIEPSE